MEIVYFFFSDWVLLHTFPPARLLKNTFVHVPSYALLSYGALSLLHFTRATLSFLQTSYNKLLLLTVSNSKKGKHNNITVRFSSDHKRDLPISNPILLLFLISI